jgi:uncharacterized protein (DUF1499 family)
MSPRTPLLLLALLAACTGSPDLPTPPAEAEFRALLAEGSGANVAATSETAEDPRLRPMVLPGAPDEVRARAMGAIAALDRWAIEDSTAPILWATRTTRLFRFVDDIHLLVEARGDSSAILARSAARLGERDLGQNRRNLAELWRALGRSP